MLPEIVIPKFQSMTRDQELLPSSLEERVNTPTSTAREMKDLKKENAKLFPLARDSSEKKITPAIKRKSVDLSNPTIVK